MYIYFPWLGVHKATSSKAKEHTWSNVRHTGAGSPCTVLTTSTQSSNPAFPWGSALNGTVCGESPQEGLFSVNAVKPCAEAQESNPRTMHAGGEHQCGRKIKESKARNEPEGRAVVTWCRGVPSRGQRDCAHLTSTGQAEQNTFPAYLLFLISQVSAETFQNEGAEVPPRGDGCRPMRDDRRVPPLPTTSHPPRGE